MRATWGQVEKYVKGVQDKYSTTELTGVYGIPRGGLVLAVMISHALDIPVLPYPKYGCLIVDDISDTGDTLAYFVQQRYATTTMFYHKDTKAMPDYSMYEKKGDDWVVFPWEVGCSNRT